MQAIVQKPSFQAWNGTVFSHFNNCFEYEKELLKNRILTGIHIFDIDGIEYNKTTIVNYFSNPYDDSIVGNGYAVIDKSMIDIALCKAIIKDEQIHNYSDFYYFETDYFAEDFTDTIQNILKLTTNIYFFEDEFSFANLIPIDKKLSYIYNNIIQKYQISFNDWILIPKEK